MERLELFRTETLRSFDAGDKMKQDAKDAVDELLDSAVSLDSFVIPEMPIANSRAGLYVYINALVRLMQRSLDQQYAD